MFGSSQVKPENVAIYIRWSTDEQSQGTTLEVQRDACKHFLLSQGWQYREEMIFVDDGYSGANMNRPALTKLRELVKAGDVSAVVVYKLDRLSRNLLDCVSLVRQEWAPIALFSTMERFDTHSSLGQMVFNMLVSFAEFERNVIRERTMSGKAKRREQGRNAGARYPFGYRKSADGGFEIDPEKATIVRSIFAEYNAGVGMKAVCDRLNREGIPSPSGKQWRVCTLSLLLGNPNYAGHYAAGYYSAADGFKSRGKQPKYLLKNAIPPIITQEEYDLAQLARRDRFRPGWPMPKDSDYLLSTILTCGVCGSPMTGHSNQEGRKYYRCEKAKHFRTCENGGVPKEELEQKVLEEIRRDLAPERLMQYYEYLESLRVQEVERRRAKVRAIAPKMEDARRRRERLDKDYFAGDLSAQQYARLGDKLDADIASLAEELETAEKALRDYERAPVDHERIAVLAKRVDGLTELTVDQTRQLLRELLAELTAFRVKKRGRWNHEPVEVTMVHRVKVLPAAVGEQA